MKTIAVDIDDTLNNFSETLRTTEFAHDATYTISEDTFHCYLEKVRSGLADESDLLSTEFSFFRVKIHLQCYELAAPRQDGVEFMRWLKANQWRIVICTHRDLRRAGESTKKWLRLHGIPFDHLFMTMNKLLFCRAWNIDCLVDDHISSLVHAAAYGVKVFYPLLPKLGTEEYPNTRGFERFEELKEWIRS